MRECLNFPPQLELCICIFVHIACLHEKGLLANELKSIKAFFNFLCIYFIIPCTLVHYHFLRTWAKSSSVLRQIQPWLSQFSRNKATTPFCQTDRLRLLGGRRMHTVPKWCIFRLEFIIKHIFLALSDFQYVIWTFHENSVKIQNEFFTIFQLKIDYRNNTQISDFKKF